MTKLDKVLAKFAKDEGIAVLKDDTTGSMIRWIGSGSLTKEQLNRLSKLYEEYKEI